MSGYNGSCGVTYGIGSVIDGCVFGINIVE